MNLLLKREQRRTLRGRTVFRLWVKAEMAEDERALIDRYNIADAILIEADDLDHLKWAAGIGLITFAVVGLLVASYTYDQYLALAVGASIGLAAGYWWLNEKRETIWMRDLLYGRRFKCRSVIELAKKEAMLDNACIALRQVVETAKHWEGVETRPVPVLSPQEAKEVVVRL